MGEAPDWVVGDTLTVLVDTEAAGERVTLHLDGRVIALNDEAVALAVAGAAVSPELGDAGRFSFWFERKSFVNIDLNPGEVFLRDAIAEYDEA